MTSMAPAGEGGGGSGTSTTTAATTTTTTTSTTTGGGSSAEQAPSPTAPPAQQQQPATQPPPQQQHQQHPPPSPLSGCYLLVVLPEPHTAQHKDLILNRLAKGFLSWDKDSCHVDLEKELQALVAQSPEGEEARNGERLIQYATENLVTEVLIYPQSNTLLQCIRNLLASFTKHRHIIHAGYTFGGNGSWILQDGTFSLADFLDAFSEHEVQRVLRAYENSVTVDIHCAGVGDWSTARLSKEACTRACRVRVNPDDVLTAGVPAITSFTNYIGQYLIAQTLDQLMEPSDVVGNIRFSHPTLYVFPGGQGDAALFGINGFNMLVDGGFARKACFWDFTRHLDRLDAVLVTRINNSNVGGMSSVLGKKKEMHVYPQIGHFFCNLVERRHSNSPDGDKDIDPLILNLIDIGQEMMVNLRHINLRPHPCYRDPEPINLYHKVGHGTLDMYVLSPSKDSREVREFMSKWNASDSKLFAGSHRKDSNSIIFPVQNLVSICALLVWQPANPEDTITRILFPGSTPQHKIFEGFERLKHLEFLKHPVCTAKSLSPSTSLVALKDKAAILKPKLGSIERETKRLAEIRREKKDVSEIKAVKKDSVVDDSTAKISTGKPTAPLQPKPETKAKKVVENKKIESEAKENKRIERELKETKKEAKKVEKSEPIELETKKTDAAKVETEKTAPAKEPKMQKIEAKKKETKETPKPIVKPSKTESVPKPSKPIEKKPKPSGEKKDIMKSSPTTPKKSMNVTASKTEISKTVAKSTIKITSKISSATPAKSAKDANNRMVVEQKNNELSSMASSAGTKAPAKAKAAERKPISRRTKPVSPSKARLPISPAKSTRSTPTASVKSEKDAVIRKVKGGTTDSSAVSTPSGIEPESAIKLIDKNLTEKSEDMSLDSIESKVLADLKEEREVVEEIEAVLQKAERIEEARKEERFEGDDEITAEATDKKEEDMTEEDVTAEMDDAPKKISRKESQELTEEDEYLIVEKEEIYTEDSVQSGDAEQKHHLDEAESEKTQVKIEKEPQAEEFEQEEEKEVAEEKKDEIPEKTLVDSAADKETRISVELSPEHKELLKEEMKQIIASATEAVQKTEDKDDSGKKDSEDITKEPSSLSPDKLDSSVKPDIDKKEVVPEKLEESQERISTLESGATTTAPTLPEDERIPLDEIKEDVDEKHVVEEVKEKDISVKQKEPVPEAIPVVSKPEVKVLDVRPPPHHGFPRDVVKTPDEVADLPVHEEVDPKLYRVDDIEKDKDTKVSPPFQEIKEPVATPPVKEQKDKGVFSFFGKVADKFEKGIDKLTKKARRDSADKDVEDKSSKSSSPKESKPQEKAVFEEVDIDKVFPKIGKIEEKSESFEHAKPQISDIKVAAIKETAIFLQEEIKDSKIESVEQIAIAHTPQAKLDDSAKDEKLETKLKDEVIEGFEEVEAFVEEASMKFRNVKDSLQDSLESLEEKVDEASKLATVSKDTVTDTLTEVAEKLVDIESDVSSFVASKEPEKVKFIIPSSEDLEGEEDDSDGVTRDFKEAVRDVAEVLVGTAGIEFEKEDKPKDVVEIVKKVAEVLKEDDFLSEKTLFVKEGEGKDEDKSSPPEDAVIPKKVGITEELAPHEVVEDLLEGGVTTLPTDYEKADTFEMHEEPCIQVVKDRDVAAPSPVKDEKADKEDAKRICEDIMKDDFIEKPVTTVVADYRADVMDLGLEEVCVKTVAKREVHDEKLEEEEKVVIESEISFEQKLSPGKAELVTVTPGSTPTSPKLATELGLPELLAEYRDILNKETSLESIIEEFIVVKKHKVTTQVLEYIAIVKRVPKEKVINLIQEIIIKHKIPRESVAESVQVLRTRDDISSEKRLEVEDYIINEYLNKNKKISLVVIEEISTKKMISKRIVIEIIEEIIVKRKISRESVFDISEETYFILLKEDLEKELKAEFSHIVSSEQTQLPIEEIEEKLPASTSVDEIEDKIVDGFVTISSTDAVEAFLQQERKKSHEESKIVDDFEAVEQEYKVQGVPSILSAEKTKDQKDKEVEEISEDVSDVIEADEKFVKETIEKSDKEKDIVEGDVKEKDLKLLEQEFAHDLETSEISEVDTKEKYLDEAKEKTVDIKEAVKEDQVSEKVESEFESKILSEKSDIPKAEEKVIPEKSHADATGRSDLKDIGESSVASKDTPEKPSDEKMSLQESGQDSQEGIVRRMVVTASSEDGGHETEICPTGTITFNKTPTPEDSLKDVDIKSSPEKDSLIFDKDISRSAGSTPEKDSMISDKSDQGEKITPEDSLEKSPVVVSEAEAAQSDKEKIYELKLGLDQSVEIIKGQLPLTSLSEKTEKPSVLATTGMVKTPDSLHSGDASPAESVFSKSPTEKAFSHPPETLEEVLFAQIDKIDDRLQLSTEEGAKLEQLSAIKSLDIAKEEKDKSPEKSISSDVKDSLQEIVHDDKEKDSSKSPSVEKDADKLDRSPSIEKDTGKKESTPEKSAFDEVGKKEPSPEKSVVTEDIKHAEDRSKSPSLEKETVKKEESTDKLVIFEAEAISGQAEGRSKSPSVEKEAGKQETLLETAVSDDEKHAVEKIQDKSPSVEKDVGKKDSSSEIIEKADKSKSPSPEKEKEQSLAEEAKESEKVKHPKDDKSKSPSVEKEISAKEASPEKISVEDTPGTEIKDRSKSPSSEKEISKREVSPEKVVSSEDVKLVDITGRKPADKSKSPSSEKEIFPKELSPEKPSDDTKHAPEEPKDKSKSSSVEKEIDKKDKQTGEVLTDQVTVQSKSPSVEKETSVKETTPKKTIIPDKAHETTDVVIDMKKDKPRSPSIESEVSKKDESPKKLSISVDIKHDAVETVTDHVADKSKSPSVEKETSKKVSPEKVLAADDEEQAGDTIVDEIKDRSKSPSTDKEISKEKISTTVPDEVVSSEEVVRSKSASVEKEISGSVQDTSRSQSVEKEIGKKERSPEKVTEFVSSEKEDRSKSPSIEKDVYKKEATPEKSLPDGKPEKVTDDQIKTEDRSKSPSVEKDIYKKEVSPDKLESCKVDDRSKSPSVDKETAKDEVPLKEATELEDTKHEAEKRISSEEKDKSKSPSVEKEIIKEPTLEHALDKVSDHVDEKVKSPSVEKEIGKTEGDVKHERLAEDTAQTVDRSKSPSIEKETDKKVADVVTAEVDDKVTSSTDQKVTTEKETSLECDTISSKPKDPSKSPSVEKEECKKEPSPDKTPASEDIKHAEDEFSSPEVKDKSKSPSVEKETDTKEALSEKSFTDEAKLAVDEASVRTDDKLKSPSVEKETDKKEASPEKILEPASDVTDKLSDRSKSSSIEKEISKKMSLTGVCASDVVTYLIDDLISDKVTDRSKSPSVEKEVSKKEASPEKIPDSEDLKHAIEELSTPEVKDKSKSPSVEKEAEIKEASPEKSSGDDVKLPEDETPDKKDDKSKSPSVEKETDKKEALPDKISVSEELIHVGDESITHEVKDQTKSPSVEKEVSDKEASLAKDLQHAVDELSIAEVKDKSKSPSIEKEVSKKEASPEKTTAPEDSKGAFEDISSIEVKEKSKSPSVEKETSKKEASPEISTSPEESKDAVDDISHAEIKDESKSPSVEKEVSKKEASPEKTTAPEDSKDAIEDISSVEVKDKSKSPSVEKETSRKEASPERTMAPEDSKDAVEDISSAEVKDKSKSPSVEKEIDTKEVSPEKSSGDDVKLPVAEAAEKTDDKSKSPSIEKETDKKEESSEEIAVSEVEKRVEEGSIIVEAKDRSKSPSAEKESKKEASPEKSTVSKDSKDAIEDISSAEAKDKSKSPSVEKEEVAKVDDKSKSPSVEKETDKKEASPEKIPISEDLKHAEEEFITDEVKDKSKSPSVEKEASKKEASPEKTPIAEDLKHAVEELSSVETMDKSKSPSVEKEAVTKEASPEKSSSDDVKQLRVDEASEKAQSPSQKKETDKKEVSPEKISVSEDGKHIGDESSTDEVKGRSKSPSVEKEASKKEASPEKTSDAVKHTVEELSSTEVKDKSKSPSVEKETVTKEASPEKSSVDDVKIAADETPKTDDKSKSPSIEKEVGEKEASPDKSFEPVTDATDKLSYRSKSPSSEKEIVKKEASDKPIIATDLQQEIEDKASDKIDTSKLPNVEMETSQKESSPEKSDVKKETDGVSIDKADGRSKSPSVEKERVKREATSEELTSLDDAKHTASVVVSSQVSDKSKSPSIEKDIVKKEMSPEKLSASEDIKQSIDETVSDRIEDKSRSQSLEKHEHKKEESPEKVSIPSDVKHEVPETAPHPIDDKSKSPSVEKEISNKEASSVPDKSRSPSADKDVESKVFEKSRSSSIVSDSGKDKKQLELTDKLIDLQDDSFKLKEEKISDKTVCSSTTAPTAIEEKEKSPIISDREKSPSILSDKSEDVKETGDKRSEHSKSPSLERDAKILSTSISSTPKSPSPEKVDKPRSSIASDKLHEKDIVDVGQISESKHQVDEKLEKSRSPSLSEAQLTERHDFDKSKSISPVSEKTRADIDSDRKASVTSIDSHAEDKGKDRSRSHSLFESGDRTPLVRSRAASLYEDKLVEKLGTLEHTKETLGHTDDIFEEKDEFRLSHEAIDEFQKDASKTDVTDQISLSCETKKAVEDYISSEYIQKKRIITLHVINEISITYKIDRCIVIKIIKEIIANLKLKQETIIDFDEKDCEETMQKLLDDEEKLTNYINDEFVAKKRKINSKIVDEIASSKSVSRHLVILVIENIISAQNLRRESIVDVDFSESQDTFPQETKADTSDIKKTEGLDKDSASRKSSVTDKHVKDTLETSKSVSPSPEPASLTASKSDRSEPHIDEEISISENKRIEVETLLIDAYITRGIKITETILDQIVTKTSLPKYIIIEIIEEIVIKKHLSRDAIADKSIFNDDDYDDSQLKLDYEGKTTPEVGERKSSGYSTPDARQYDDRLEKGIPYTDYESPFHKAFMGGMTEMRTTHITTLSGKSTPDFGARDGTPDSTSEIISATTTTITNVPEKFEEISDAKSAEHSQLISSKRQSKVDEQIQDPTEGMVVVLKTTQITTYPDDGTEITKEVTRRESISEKAQLEKELVEEEETETVTRIIKRESVCEDDSNQESTKIVTTKTTKTITSEKELDPVSLIDTFETSHVPEISTTVGKTISVTTTTDAQGKTTVTESQTSSIVSTTSTDTTNVEEKLISLETHTSDTSKTSISSTYSQDVKSIFESGKFTPDVKEEDQTLTFMGKDLMDHTVPEQMEQSAFPLIKDLITDEKSYSGKSSPDVSLPKDIAFGGSTGKSTPDISMSPLIRDGSMIQSHLSGRSTPDKRSDNRSRTATPEGFRSGDVIRTIITTTRTMSDDGEIITTTQEVTEATNEKGETVVLTKKTDITVDERLPESLISDKPVDAHQTSSPSSDLIDKEVDPTSPRSDLSSGHSRAATHIWGSSEERHTYSDEEQPSPPFSSSPHHSDTRLPAKEESVKTSDDFSSAAMSSSFYGELPSESIHFGSSITKSTESHVEPDEFSFKKFTVEKEFAGGYAEKGSKKYVDEADLDFEKALTGFKDEKGEHGESQESSLLGASSFTQELSKSGQSKSSDADGKKDPLAGWGSPLGLPSPKAPRKFNLRSPIQPCSSADLSPDSLNFDVINDWGEPMRLPSPAPTTNEVSNKGSPGTPKKEKKQTKKVISENIKNKKRSESPSKNEKRIKDSKNKVQPVYVDLTYVSHHGNSFYTALEFFKKVRARYYVFSGTEPSREVYDALLEAKKTWEDKDLEVTMIPTYDTDTLGYWVADNEEALAAHHIDLSPSASRCTINLQDHETSCSAYRLEF